MKNTAIKHDEVYQYEPLTENQKKAFDAWADGDHLALIGTAGNFTSVGDVFRSNSSSKHAWLNTACNLQTWCCNELSTPANDRRS